MQSISNLITSDIAYLIAEYIDHPSAFQSWMMITSHMYTKDEYWQDKLKLLIEKAKIRFSTQISEIRLLNEVTTPNNVQIFRRRPYSKRHDYIGNVSHFDIILDNGFIHDKMESKFNILRIEYYILPNGMKHGVCTICGNYGSSYQNINAKYTFSFADDINQGDLIKIGELDYDPVTLQIK